MLFRSGVKVLKTLSLCAVLALGLNAASLSDMKVTFDGYKTKDKLVSKGTFKSVKYTFNKDNSSIMSLLKNATATVSQASVDMMGNNPATLNMVNDFFAKFSNRADVQVEFVDINGTDASGSISAKITMNGKSAFVPLNYKVANGELNASGVLDLLSFDLSPARNSLTKAAAGHAGVTWNEVLIKFNAKVK